MIFRPELAKSIRMGKKTMTRRPIVDGRCRYLAGKSYAVQPGRGKSGICRITVQAVRDEPLGEITLKDAKKEGFVTTGEFFDYWKSLYGSVDRSQPVWVISFALGDLTDTPRLLAAVPGAPHGDYVSNPHLAMKDAGEALSAHETEQYAKGASDRDQKRRVQQVAEAKDLPLEARIGRLDNLKRRQRLDISRQVRVIEQRVGRAERLLDDDEF